MKNTAKDIVAAGRDFTGSGVLASFSGQNAAVTTVQAMEEAMDAHGVKKYAPKAKSPIGVLGRIIRDVARQNKATARRAPGAAGDADNREYAARWVVSPKASLSNVKVGDSVGSAELIIDFTDADQLVIRGNSAMADTIKSRFEVERHQLIGSDITQWLSDLMMGTFRAAKTVWGKYVPPVNVPTVRDIFSAVQTIFGETHAPDPLPVATTDQLLDGITAGFRKEIDGVRKSYEKNGAKTSATDAARYKRTLDDIAARSGNYRILCGDDRINAAMLELQELRDLLEALSNDTAMRGANLELDDKPSNETVAQKPQEPSPAEKAAEAAHQAKLEKAAEKPAQRASRQVSAPPVVPPPLTVVDPDKRAWAESLELD